MDEYTAKQVRRLNDKLDLVLTLVAGMALWAGSDRAGAALVKEYGWSKDAAWWVAFGAIFIFVGWMFRQADMT